MARKYFAQPVYDSAKQFFAAVTSDYTFLTHDPEGWSDSLTVDRLGDLATLHRARPFRPALVDALSEAANASGTAAAADVLFLYYLFPLANDPSNKINAIQEILGLRNLGTRVDLRTAFGKGVGNVGSPYRRYMREIFSYYVRFCHSIVGLDGSDLRSLANIAVDEGSVRTQAGVSALLHLIDPDRFEPIVSGEHKRRIIERFEADAGPFTDEDEALRAIRAALTERGESPDFDWYETKIYDLWMTRETRIVGNEAAADRQQASEQVAWIEMSLVEKNPYKREAPYGTGYALISPVLDKNDADRYRFMREVRPGDLVLHLVDNDRIALFSYVADSYVEIPDTPHHPASEGPYYFVKLVDRTELNPPIPVDTLLRTSPYAEELARIARAGVRYLFYQPNQRLRQGAYLTPVSQEVFEVIERASLALGGSRLSDALETPEPGGDANVEPLSVERDVAGEAKQLADLTLLDESTIRQLLEALRGPSRHVILAGPPGTSKTFLALALARHLTDFDKTRLELVQFHPGYSYEQFVEGLRPEPFGNGLRYEPRDGVFKRFAGRATRGSRSGDFILVVDEINRANLPAVLGELMFALEYREEGVRLPYSEQELVVPPNLRIIATMNTADRSIRSMEVALRRRFQIFDLAPDHEALARYYQNRYNEVPRLIQGFRDLNAEISQTVGPQYRIGHTIFMQSEMNRAALTAIFERMVRPLLRQVFFENEDSLVKFTPERFFWPDDG